MLSPGRLLLRLYHQPIARLRSSIRNGGPLAEWETERGRLEMEAAAGQLGPLPSFPGTAPVTVHLLTGRRFWYQSAFCLHSFARSARVPLCVEVYDDGSIDAPCAELLGTLGPGMRIHPHGAIRERLDRLLPASAFPVLRERWLNYPNLRKLVDVHLGSSGWKLVMDSDMLFFRRPDFLLSWLASPAAPLHGIDSVESYGYSRALMEELAGAAIPARVNVGLCGLRSEALDWHELERWCATLISRERTNYYLEQALVALLVAKYGPAAVAPEADYVTLPGRDEVLAPRAVMHHYVDTSKRWYFRYGWSRIPAPPTVP